MLALAVAAARLQKPPSGRASSGAEQVPLCEHRVQKDICTKCNRKARPVFSGEERLVPWAWIPRVRVSDLSSRAGRAARHLDGR